MACSIATVQKFERLGKLNPRRDEPIPPATRGRVWFDPDEVEKVAREYKPTRQQRVKIDERLLQANVRGKIAARALPMFSRARAEGREVDLAEVCAATEADPLVIIELYETWRLGPEGVLAKREREREEAKREAEERERDRAHRADVSRREWIAMRLKVAELEKKAAIKLPSLDPKTQEVSSERRKLG